MGSTLTEKILKEHLEGGGFESDKPLSIRVDQTLTQDATGTMAYLQFEALGLKQVRTELSVSYIDHNTLQQDYRNADDHMYLRSIAARYGIILSKAGNGICHQVHLERFAVPGKTLLGSDSHTPTAGGIGCLGIGAGGLDVALAMAGKPFDLNKPKVVGVTLEGKLQNGVSAKDVILEVLRRIGVKGAVGKVLEYTGEGVGSLSVPERATITNMGAETGATTSIFPSDDNTRKYLRAHGRERDYVGFFPDDDAVYEEELVVDLKKVVPLVAKPHSPGNVVPVEELEGLAVDQVAVGSCTNSSYRDLMTAAKMLEGRRVDPNVSFVVSPGSRDVLILLSENGGLKCIVESGARLLECACGPCIGQGNAPGTKAVSLRTFNRNFEGRSGTRDAGIYLTSVETAVASALNGKFTDPRSLGDLPEVEEPREYMLSDNLIVYPPEDGGAVEVRRGPNITPLPKKMSLPDSLEGEVLIKVGDDVTTDHILPAGRYLPLRSNVPEYAKHVFEQVDPGFYERAVGKRGGFVVASENYGQGSSREHAALCPMYLGVKAVIAKSFARIHQANLINFGIVPLCFSKPGDYDLVDAGDRLEVDVSDLESGLSAYDISKGSKIGLTHNLSPKDVKVLEAGGLLNYSREGE